MLGIFVLCVLSLVQISSTVWMKEDYTWKELTFAWPTPEFKADAIKTNSYIPQNNLPYGMATWKDKIFITVPRLKPGVASTLNYITVGTDGSPALKPYPSWDLTYIPAETAQLKNNSTVVSVFRVWVDKCDRLWVLDSGTVDVFDNFEDIPDPSIYIFDLNTDTLITRYYFNQLDVTQDSILSNIVVDVPGDCADAFAYISDSGANSLIVYSLRSNTSWRVDHFFFYFDPLAGNYTVGEMNFQWADGVMGVALGEAQPDGFKQLMERVINDKLLTYLEKNRIINDRQNGFRLNRSCRDLLAYVTHVCERCLERACTCKSRRVYFHPLSSTKEFEVSNKILQNETAATDASNFHDFKVVGDRGINSQSTTSYYDENTKILFYTQVNRNGVSCWNTIKTLTPENTDMFSQCSEVLEFPNDIKIDKAGMIWILSNRLSRFQESTMNSSDINYRILSVSVQEAINGTVCM